MPSLGDQGVAPTPALGSSATGALAARLDRYFEIRKKGSTLSREVLAGTSTFLALSYIFVVNPGILAEGGVPKSVAFFATVLVSALATLAMGIWARLPFAVAPGLEMNAYVAFVVVGALGFSWQEALGLCFWSGVLMVVVTLSRLREKVIESIPEAMKSSLAAMVGIFVGIIALRITGVLVYEGVSLEGLGRVWSEPVAVLAVATVTVLLLDWLRVRAAVLVSIVVAAGFAHLIGAASSDKPVTLSSEMFDGVGALDIAAIAVGGLNVVLVLFLLDFFGSAAKFIGLTYNTSIVENGRVPRLTQGLTIDGVASAAGAAVGTSTLTTYVESGVGISAGGRTGLTATVCGLLMLAAFPFGSALQYIPVIAAGGALLYVAIKLFPPPSALRRLARVDVVALVVMAGVVFATFALDRAMAAGFGVYILAALMGRRWPNPYMVGSTALLVAGILIQEL
jgi:AGZA family xanthine/uracil permease-like MFS transporter